MSLKNLYHRLVPQSIQQGLKPLLHPRLHLVRWEVLRRAEGVIISGPFKGMKFGEEPLSLPIVAGTYELELHEIFRHLDGRYFSRVIDIGAAEGYYAVGTALWQPDCMVTAYEANSMYHDSIRHLSQINDVAARIEIKGSCSLCDLQDLGDHLADSLMIVDVEGYEKELLDPHKVPSLEQATLLVEVHDNFVVGCEKAIRQRFKALTLLRASQVGRVVRGNIR